jgi:ATP-dependent 26S proteasome regulatory subunit
MRERNKIRESKRKKESERARERERDQDRQKERQTERARGRGRQRASERASERERERERERNLERRSTRIHQQIGSVDGDNTRALDLCHIIIHSVTSSYIVSHHQRTIIREHLTSTLRTCLWRASVNRFKADAAVSANLNVCTVFVCQRTWACL